MFDFQTITGLVLLAIGLVSLSGGGAILYNLPDEKKPEALVQWTAPPEHHNCRSRRPRVQKPKPKRAPEPTHGPARGRV